MTTEPTEECGVFGVWGDPAAAQLCAIGLGALQHRGEHGAGIVSFDEGRARSHRGLGRVEAALPSAAVQGLGGAAAIGHVRYAREANAELNNVQPFVVNDRDGALAIAHNGHLLNGARLRQGLEAKGSLFSTNSDTEVILHLLATSGQSTFTNRLIDALYKVEGAHCLLLLTADKMVVVRDPMGFRPLVIGRRGPAWVVASESCALEQVGADQLREVLPGEVILVDRGGARSLRPWPEAPRRGCTFEHLRLARADSVVFGQGVYGLRRRFGERLAQEQPADVDLVLPVPESGELAALGFAAQSGAPLELGLRRLMEPAPVRPGPRGRSTAPNAGFSVVRSLVQGRRVALVDASLVRGETCRRLVELLREAGAAAVHVRVAAPPVVGPCFYGVDTPPPDALWVNRGAIEGARHFLGADSLAFLSLEGLHAVEGAAAPTLCDACFSLRYPILPQVEPERVQLALFSPAPGA
jgi:amidophosphoribosyltransferase